MITNEQTAKKKEVVNANNMWVSFVSMNSARPGAKDPTNWKTQPT
jgi:hypothetical protein